MKARHPAAAALILRAVTVFGEPISERLTNLVGYWIAGGYTVDDFREALTEVVKPAQRAEIRWPDDFLTRFAAFVHQAAERRKSANRVRIPFGNPEARAMAAALLRKGG